MWPGHHQGRAELAARDVEHAAGGAVAVWAEAGVVGVLVRRPKHIVWRSKPGDGNKLLVILRHYLVFLLPVCCHVVVTGLLLEDQGQGLTEVPVEDVQCLILLYSWMEEAAVSSPDGVTLGRGPEVQLPLTAVRDHLRHVPHVLTAGHCLPLLRH